MKELAHDSDTPDDPGSLSKMGLKDLKEEPLAVRAETEEQPQSRVILEEESKSSKVSTSAASDKAAQFQLEERSYYLCNGIQKQ